MRLAVDPRDGAIRLTLPRRAALAPALKWAESQRTWIETALAKLPVAERMAPGSTIPFEGGTLTIAWDPAGSRTVRRDGERLLVGGPEEMVAARVLRWLRAEAARRLEAETRAVGARAGVTIGRVRVGDPRSRWGSCSASGDIAYSWRLILMPPEVREATVVHEVAHRLHMNHGPDFHAAVERLLGRVPKQERDWLKKNGAAMHRVGR
jgi:predicted metal-dependent hydrolase